MLIQSLEGFGVERREVGIDRPTRLLQEVIVHLGLRVVDVLPAFREVHHEGRALFGTVDCHPTPEEHALPWRTVR